MFWPELHVLIDWRYKPVCLDKELQRLAVSAKHGRLHVDKLVRVRLLIGQNLLTLIHAEIQGPGGADLPARLFGYHIRLREKHPQHPLVSLAVLTHRHHNLRTASQTYAYEHWGFRRDQVVSLFNILDAMLVSPKSMEVDFVDAVSKIEEEHQMSYVNTIERVALTIDRNQRSSSPEYATTTPRFNKVIPIHPQFHQMNSIEKSSKLTPKPAEPRLSDLFSETASTASKGNAARFYAEMAIDLFLSARLKMELGTSRLDALPLGERIKRISSYTPSKIIDALWRIKEFGDMASHYSPSRVLADAHADAAVEDAVGLIVLILTYELIEMPLDAYEGRATLFSTTLPKAREQVLANLLSRECDSTDDAYYLFLLNKHGLALTKSGRYSTACRNLGRLLKKGRIDQAFHDEEVTTLSLVSKSIVYPGQPIAQRMEDVARNFKAVRQSFNDVDVKANEQLIAILGTLVNDITPSGFSHRVTQLLLF